LLVLNHITVIDVVHGRAEPDRAVEVEGTRDRAILPAAGYRPPSGAAVHELSGRFVLPGIVDMHAHVLFPPLGDDGRPLPSFDRETSFALLRTMLWNGITTVRDPGDAAEAAVAVRSMLASGAIPGPAPLDVRTDPHDRADAARDLRIRHERVRVREKVARQAQAGVDFIKVYQDLAPALVQAAIVEAHRRLRVIGPLPGTLPLRGRNNFPPNAEKRAQSAEPPCHFHRRN
jgi:imidazolonepropionase-like amidohydrolase